jgi:hypothetical protein
MKKSKKLKPEKPKTMNEVYGEERTGTEDHLCCPNCGHCITCGDCHCKMRKEWKKRGYME